MKTIKNVNILQSLFYGFAGCFSPSSYKRFFFIDEIGSISENRQEDKE